MSISLANLPTLNYKIWIISTLVNNVVLYIVLDEFAVEFHFFS